MPSINDDDLFDFNGHAGEFEDNDYADAQKAYKLAMGGAIHDLKNRVRTAKVRAELMGASPADALRAATVTIGSAHGHELSSSDATRAPQALESDEVIDPQVANLEAEVSRLQQDNTRLQTAAQRASNLQEQLDERDRLVASKDAEILRLNGLLTTAVANLGTPPAPTPGPAPAGPAPTPAPQPRHATPVPTPPAPPATAAPAQPAPPATPAPAQPATPTPPATPAAPTQQTPPRRTSGGQRPAGNFGPAAGGDASQTTNPPTRVIPTQPQQQPQRQPRPGFGARVGNFLLGPTPEQPSRTRQNR